MLKVQRNYVYTIRSRNNIIEMYVGIASRCVMITSLLLYIHLRSFLKMKNPFLD